MLTDEVKIKVFAGKGGDGIVAFDKVKMSLGPTGGRGGDGGSIYLEGVSDIFALNKYRHLKEHYAENGKNGRGNRSDGQNGKDLFLTVPVGTIAHNLKNGEKIEITQVGQKVLIAKNGIGGRGNFYFRSSKNTSPQEYEKGALGENFEFILELRLIADIGIIGLPSAGKSSLLNELTLANAKTGAYHFTTLEPNLGVLDGLIIADIPGIIEGASKGKGLGVKFLRHIRRTKVLIHCISSDSEDIERDYNIIKKEMEDYDKELLNKKEIIFLTKSDLIEKDKLAKKINKIKNIQLYPVSIYDYKSIEKIKEKIFEIEKLK